MPEGHDDYDKDNNNRDNDNNDDDRNDDDKLVCSRSPVLSALLRSDMVRAHSIKLKGDWGCSDY